MFRLFAISLMGISLIGCSEQDSVNVKPVEKLENTQVNLVVQKFLGICVNNMPRIDKVVASAEMLKWQPLTREQALMVAPADPLTEFSGWYLKDGESQFMVGVSESIWKNKPAPSCSIATADVPPLEVKTALKAMLNNPTILDDFTEGGQQVSMYEYKSSLVNGIVIMTDASPSNVDALSISFLAPSEI